MGARRAGLAAAVGARRVASTSRGRPPWPRTSGTATPATRRSSGAAAATPWRAGWPACSRRTPPSGRSCSSTGPPGRDTTGWATTLDADLAWQPPLWRALAAAVAAPSPPERHAATLERLRGRPVRPAAAGLAVRPHPHAGHRDRAARARSADPPRPPPLAARTPATTCGGGSPTSTGADAPPGRRQPPPGPAPAARLARPRPARAPAQPRPGRAPTTTRSRPPRAARTPCSAGSRPTCAPTRSGPTGRALDRRRPVGPGAPLPRRRPARSRCCARCCSGSSRTTRRLEPRDILVMCPDIENYAPLITAAFGLGDVVEGGHPAHRLRVQLADRALTQHQPAARRRRPAARRRRQPRHRQRRPRPRPEPAGPPPVRLRRRRPRRDGRLGARVRGAVGLRRRAPRSRSASATSRTPGASASTGCSPASRCPTTPRPGSAPPCRSTTSAATGSSWPAGSPSTSTGWSPRPTG